MDKQNLMPQAAQPVNRITTGQLPTECVELSEEALYLHGDEAFNGSVLPSSPRYGNTPGYCSYDGDDTE